MQTHCLLDICPYSQLNKQPLGSDFWGLLAIQHMRCYGDFASKVSCSLLNSPITGGWETVFLATENIGN